MVKRAARTFLAKTVVCKRLNFQKSSSFTAKNKTNTGNIDSSIVVIIILNWHCFSITMVFLEKFRTFLRQTSTNFEKIKRDVGILCLTVESHLRPTY